MGSGSCLLFWLGLNWDRESSEMGMGLRFKALSQTATRMMLQRFRFDFHYHYRYLIPIFKDFVNWTDQAHPIGLKLD